MSRYVCHFLVNLAPQHVRSSLKQLFEACKMDAIYETNDYLMAREIPGRVIFTKLVSAEVLIDVTTAAQSAVRLSFVVKNEELPLNPHNHCREVFDLLRLTIAQNYDWEAIDNIRWQSLSSGESLSIPAISRVAENLSATAATSSPESDPTPSRSIVDPDSSPSVTTFTTALN
jgi:hypothetical protein